MKENNITQLIEKAKKEVILFGYSETSIKEYNIIFNEIIRYFESIKVNIFDYDVIWQYFIQKYNIKSFNNIRISKYQLKRLRACKILNDVNKNESIKRQYDYTVENKITNNCYQKIFNTFLAYIEKIGLSRNVRIGIKRVTNNFLLHLSDLKIEKIEEINFNTLLSFIEKFPENRKSKNLYLYYLRTFLDYLYNHNLIDYNLSINIPNSKLKKGRRELTILSLLYDSALRISELLNLKVQDINLNDIKTVQVWHGKGNKNRKVPISDDTANIIRIYIKDYNKQLNDYLFTNNRNEKLCSNTIRKILNKYCDKVRKEDSTLLEHIYSHLLRHSKATHLINKGVSVLEVKEFLGHASLESTQIYITTDIMKKRDALKTIENQIIEDNITINYTDDDIYNWLNNLEKVKL